MTQACIEEGRQKAEMKACHENVWEEKRSASYETFLGRDVSTHTRFQFHPNIPIIYSFTLCCTPCVWTRTKLHSDSQQTCSLRFERRDDAVASKGAIPPRITDARKIGIFPLQTSFPILSSTQGLLWARARGDREFACVFLAIRLPQFQGNSWTSQRHRQTSFH